MANLLSRIGLKFVLTAVGIVFVGALPALFLGIRLDFSKYAATIESLFSAIIEPSQLVYEILGREYPLFPNILESWSYTMTLLFIAFFLAFIIALTLTYFTMPIPKKMKRKIKFILFTTESIPDLLVTALFILVVITIYQQTDILFFNIAVYDDRAYVLPILAITILPTVLLYRAMVLDFEEQTTRQYVQLAKAKGLEAHKILSAHILRNALISIFQNSKYIIWFMLSNLLVVEYVFNIHGVLYFMFMRYSPEVLTVGLLLTFIPIFTILAIGQVIIERAISQKVEI